MSTTEDLRETRQSSDEKRLFMSWQDGGERVKADIDLLMKAGLKDAAQGLPLHFYHPETEQMLAQLELSFLNKPAEQIRLTYFQVKKSGNSFEFVVTNQKLR